MGAALPNNVVRGDERTLIHKTKEFLFAHNAPGVEAPPSHPDRKSRETRKHKLKMHIRLYSLYFLIKLFEETPSGVCWHYTTELRNQKKKQNQTHTKHKIPKTLGGKIDAAVGF